MRLSRFFREVFARNTDAQIIKAMRKGLRYDFCEGGFGDMNLYTAAIIKDSPKLVMACIRNGADPVEVDMPTLYYPYPAVSALNIALQSGSAKALAVLIGEGGWPEGLFRHGIAWNLRMNLCPETEEDVPAEERENFREFKRLLNARSEALKVFAQRCGDFPGFSKDYELASFFNLDYNPDLLQSYESLTEREVNAFYEVSLAHEDMAYPFPCQGTRTNALWHAPTPMAMKELLKERGPHMRDCASWTALHHVAMYAWMDYYFMPEDVAQVLIDAGADVNAMNPYGVTPLMLACGHAPNNLRTFELVKVLARNGANSSSYSSWLYRGWQTMLREVLEEIIRSAQGKGISAKDLDLFVKALWASPEGLASVLDEGADINTASAEGFTPLMLATVFNDIEAVQFLVDRGADASPKNSAGETALAYGAHNSDDLKMKVIVNGGGDLADLKNTDRAFYRYRMEHKMSRPNRSYDEAAERLRTFGLDI